MQVSFRQAVLFWYDWSHRLSLTKYAFLQTIGETWGTDCNSSVTDQKTSKNKVFRYHLHTSGTYDSVSISLDARQVAQHSPLAGRRGRLQGVGGHSLLRHNARPLWHRHWMHLSRMNVSPSCMTAPFGPEHTMWLISSFFTGSSVTPKEDITTLRTYDRIIIWNSGCQNTIYLRRTDSSWRFHWGLDSGKSVASSGPASTFPYRRCTCIGGTDRTTFHRRLALHFLLKYKNKHILCRSYSAEGLSRVEIHFGYEGRRISYKLILSMFLRDQAFWDNPQQNT